MLQSENASVLTSSFSKQLFVVGKLFLNLLLTMDLLLFKL